MGYKTGKRTHQPLASFKALPHGRYNNHELTNECLFTNASGKRTGGHMLDRTQRATSTD